MTRRILWLIGALWLTLPVVGGAQSDSTFESITFADTAIGFTAATLRPTGTQGTAMSVCSGKVETAQIRVRYDGTAPTTTVGMILDVGDIVIVRGYPHLDRFLGIRTGSTSGVVQFSCVTE